jgi:hypothetical protein
MEQYDVLIVGNDIGSLVTALFLARKMRKVMVFQESDPVQVKDVEDFGDESGNRFIFKNYVKDSIPGLDQNALMYRYFELCGLTADIKALACQSDMIVRQDHSISHRIRNYDQYLIYLVRYFPKQRDRIHRFFKDLSRHYQNYLTQQINMVSNAGYTITSLMIEWGDYSLKSLLEKYFTDSKLIEEFMLNACVNGLEIDQLSCYHFFIKFFTGLYSGEHYLYHSLEDLRKLLMTKLQAINRNMIQTRRIKKYVLDEDGTIQKVIDEKNIEYGAKHFVIANDPKSFYEAYFPDHMEQLEGILKYYPNLGSKSLIQTLYIGLNQKSEAVGIDQLNYFFETQSDETVKLIRLFNYKLFDKEAASSKNGAIYVELAYQEGVTPEIKQVLARLYDACPRLSKAVCAYRLGKPQPYLSMLSDESVRKGLSIDDQIAIESLVHLKMFDNLYLMGCWLRPEAGLFGLFQAGIIYGDTIEERLYFGEDDDEFFYLSNDEIMMMLRHNYGKKLLGKMEKHINFHIGKSSYFIRTKGKNITIHRGEYISPDLSIYTTNDKLSGLLLKKTSLEAVLKSGGFKYQGKESDLYEIAEAFVLDDFQEEDTSYQPKSKIYFLGVKFLFAYLLIWGTMAFLSNYYKLIWLMPFALVLSCVVTYVKFIKYRETVWFEYLIDALLAIFTLMAALWPDFNNQYNDNLFLAVIALIFLISWIVNKPIVHDFHQYDFKRDYAQTTLFKVINNGLTLVWAIIFASIMIFTYITGVRYVSALYNLVFLGFFLTYFYPVLYVRTNIKS